MSLADEEGQDYRVIGRLDDIHDIIVMQNQLRTEEQMDEVTGELRDCSYCQPPAGKGQKCI